AASERARAGLRRAPGDGGPRLPAGYSHFSPVRRARRARDSHRALARWATGNPLLVTRDAPTGHAAGRSRLPRRIQSATTRSARAPPLEKQESDPVPAQLRLRLAPAPARGACSRSRA